MGGFGEVWVAFKNGTEEARAFKFCFKAERLRALRREITLFRLMKETLGERPDIVHLYDTRLDEAPYYLESEYTAGGNLAEWIEELGGVAEAPLAMRLEIVAQVAYANAFLNSTPLRRSPERVTNVVFMGMGEPLANYANTVESIRRMTDVMGMSARSITVSTVGFVPGMRKLIEEPWPVYLAVSLHSTIPSERSKLVPINDRYPIDEVIAAASDYYEAKGRRISLEWTLIADENDSDEEAVGLAQIARQLRAHVNVIALNPTPLSTDRPPDRDNVNRFIGTLKRNGANVTLRDTRGQDIDAACGQLRLRARSS